MHHVYILQGIGVTARVERQANSVTFGFLHAHKLDPIIGCTFRNQEATTVVDVHPRVALKGNDYAWVNRQFIVYID